MRYYVSVEARVPGDGCIRDSDWASRETVVIIAVTTDVVMGTEKSDYGNMYRGHCRTCMSGRDLPI